MKSLFKNSLFNILYTVSNVIFPLMIAMITSRTLMAVGIGKVAFAQNIASYFTIFAALGLPLYGIREIAKCKDNYSLNVIFSELFLINFISTIVASIGYFFLVINNDNFVQELPLYLVCGINVVLNFFNIDWFYKGREEYSYITLRSLVVKIISFLCVVLLVRNPNDYVIYALISSFAIAGNYIFNIIHARRYVKFTTKGLNCIRHIKPLMVIAVSVFFATLYSKIDITCLGIMGNDSYVGLYSNAHKSVNVLLAVTTAITGVFLPRLSYLYKSEKKEFDRVVQKGGEIVFLFAIPMFFGTIILASDVVNLLFGTAFHEIAPTVRIFALLIIICSVGDFYCYQLLIATGHEGKRIISNFIGASVNIALNVCLIPLFHFNGAAIASVISEFAINSYLFVFLYRKIKFAIPVKLIGKSFVSSMAMSVIVILIVLYVESSILTCILGFTLGCIVYFICLVLFKEDMALECIDVIKRKINHY